MPFQNDHFQIGLILKQEKDQVELSRQLDYCQTSQQNGLLILIFYYCFQMKNYMAPSQTSLHNYTESARQVIPIDKYSNFYYPDENKYMSPLTSTTLDTKYGQSSQRQLHKVSSVGNFYQSYQPQQAPCQCGMAVEATKLRIQNSQLKKQIQHLKRIGSVSSMQSHDDNNYRSKFQIYQQYLSNSEINNDTLRKQNNELRQQTHLLDSLKRKIQVLEEEKRVMEHNLREQMEENMNIQQQYQSNFYDSPAGVYVEELEKNNKHLILENKRLTGIIKQRITSSFR